jgi:hypothetical protein
MTDRHCSTSPATKTSRIPTPTFSTGVGLLGRVVDSHHLELLPDGIAVHSTPFTTWSGHQIVSSSSENCGPGTRSRGNWKPPNLHPAGRLHGQHLRSVINSRSPDPINCEPSGQVTHRASTGGSGDVRLRFSSTRDSIPQNGGSRSDAHAPMRSLTERR